MSRLVIIAIGSVIALPLVFAAAGGGRSTGLVIGVLLVVAGIAYGLSGAGSDGERD